MGITCNKDAYRNMIEIDKKELRKHMPKSLERDHLESILDWTVDKLYDDNEKKMMKKAFEHGKNVATFLVGGFPDRYAPLTFDSWYNKLKEEEINSKDNNNED